MGKVWVLDTETKGTGANMVPLERARKRSSATDPVLVPREPSPRPEPAPEPIPPKRFRIVDVMTRQTLADDVSTREAADVLRGVRSIVDVNVYVWLPARARWQMLPFADLRAIWDLAHTDESAHAAGAAD